MPELTARYSYRRLYDLAGAVDKLPNLVPNDRENMPLRLTGTDGKAVVPGRISGHSSASSGTLRIMGSTSVDASKSLEKRPIGTVLHQSAAINMSEDDGTRTRNHRIDSPLVPHSNPLQAKQLTSIPDSRCSAGCSDQQGEGGISDSELARLVAAWPTLPDAIRRGILAMVNATG